MTAPSRGLVPGLAITETVSWGVLYYAFPVLLPAMERDLGWSRTTLVGAYTAAVIVTGLAALPAGRLLDRHPARPLMTAGSLLGVAAVVAWAASSSIGTFYLAWIAAGAAMAFVLYEPAQVVLVQQFGHRATRAITTLTLVAGFASTIFQPVTALLADRLGWRSALVVLAAGLAAVTIPIHLAVLPRTVHHLTRPTDTAPRSPTNPTVTLLTIAFTLSMAAMAAGIVHLIPYLVDHGWTPLTAAIAAGTLGATQVAARVAFGPLTRRIHLRHLAGIILGLPAVGVVILAISNGTGVAWLAVATLGAAQGTATLLRPMLLAQLNGPHGYGRLAATSAATTTIARATAPLALAAIAATAGYGPGLTMFAAASLAGAAVARHALHTNRPSDRRASVDAALGRR